MDNVLEDILAQIAGLGERGAEVPRVALRSGLVEAVDTDDGSITVRVGDYGDATAYYPGLIAVGSVTEGDAVYWLQDFSGTGVVLGVSTPGVSNSAGVYAGPYPPGNPPDNKLWFNTQLGKLFIWFDDGDSEQWVDLSGGGGSPVVSSPTPPSSPSADMLWFNTTTGQLFIYYSDIDSSQWVELSGGGATVFSGPSPPADPLLNTLWFSSITGQMFIYYDDGNSEQWVEVSGSGAGGGTGSIDGGTPTSNYGATSPIDGGTP